MILKIVQKMCWRIKVCLRLHCDLGTTQYRLNWASGFLSWRNKVVLIAESILLSFSQQ